jgi:uncharacterized protein (TIRG00374 family)
MRRIILLLLIIFGISFVLTRQDQAQQVLETLQKGDLRWLAIALLVHLLYLVNIGASLRAIYRLLGMNEKIERLTLLAAAANFVIVVAPSAGIGGIAIFAADAQRRGHPTGRATTAAAVYTFFDYLATLFVVLLGLFILFQRNQLHGGEITATLILVGLAISLGTLLYLGMKSGERLGQALAKVGKFLNRLVRPFIRREYFDLDRAHEFGLDAAEGLQLAQTSRGGLWVPFVLGLSTKMLMMIILMMMFLAFHQPFALETLIAGFSIGYLFTIVSPTPSGVGFVETAMTLALTSMRVGLAPAALIVLSYRGFTLWLTLAYGMVAMRWVGLSTETEEVGSPSAQHESGTEIDQNAVD